MRIKLYQKLSHCQRSQKYHGYSRRIYGQKPQEFLFTKYVDKICMRSVMEAELVRTIDKYWNAVRV